MLAYDYPLLGIFWTMLWFALFFIWIWIVVAVFIDIFRSHDLGGFAKALWVIFVVILPFLGVLLVLDNSWPQHAGSRPPAGGAAGRGSSVGTSKTSLLDRRQPISSPKLADLKARGVITDAEFEAEKAKVLSS